MGVLKFSHFAIGLIMIPVMYFIFKRIIEIYQTWKVLKKIPTYTAYPKLGPFLGNIPFILKSPKEIFERQKQIYSENYPIFKIWILYKCGIHVLDADDCKQILNQKNEKSLLAFQNWLRSGSFVSEGGPLWQHRRKMLQGFFNVNNMQNFIEVFNEETEQFIETNLSAGIYETHSLFTKLIFNGLTSICVGKNDLSISKEKYLGYYHRILDLITERCFRVWKQHQQLYKLYSSYYKEIRTVSIMNRLLEKVIIKREENSDESTDSLLGFLLKHKKDGAIENEGIKDEVHTAILGGHDTVSATISLLLMLLANHPEVQENVYQEILEKIGKSDMPNFEQLLEIKYAECCIYETLRLYAPGAFMSRKLSKSIVTKSGYEIPKGYSVYLHPYNMQNNPKYWPDPEVFNPDRFSGDVPIGTLPFFVFGSGPRVCIGKKVAMLNLKCILCGVLRKYKLEPVDNANSIGIYWNVNLNFENGVKVKFVPRNFANNKL